jgi:hypothetical protein
MLSAKSDVQVDTSEVRVTEWRLAPGSATGHHTHGMCVDGPLNARGYEEKI